MMNITVNKSIILAQGLSEQNVISEQNGVESL